MHSTENNFGIGLLGAGGQAVELRGYCESEIKFTALDRSYMSETKSETLEIDIAEPGLEARNTPVVIAVGAPGLKRRMVDVWPGQNFATVIAQETTVAADADLGTGTVIAPGARVMASAQLGQHVLVNTNSVVSHESRIGDFCTLSPGVTVGGKCVIEAGVFIGIGATVADGIHIGQGAVIGAGAVVLSDVLPLQVVAGVPARLLRTAEDWLEAI